jgi:hypothetical protein
VDGVTVGLAEALPTGAAGEGEWLDPVFVLCMGRSGSTLTARLGYPPVDEQWGSPGRPADPRDPATIKDPEALADDVADGAAVPGAAALEQWLRSRLETAGEQAASRWQSCAAERFLLVSRAAGGSEAAWMVDVMARSLTPDDGGDDTPDDGQDDDVTWSVLASPQTWQAVQAGQANLQGALRQSHLRYCPAGQDGPVLAQTRIAMLADLLGLSSWRPTAAALPEEAAATPEDAAAPATAVAS